MPGITLHKYGARWKYGSGAKYGTYSGQKSVKVVYKIYEPNGTYVGILNDVVSDLRIEKNINGGLGELRVVTDKSIDDYSQGTLLNFNNRIKIYVNDRYNDWLLVYEGYISAYNPFLNERREGTEITVLPAVAKLNNDFYRTASDLEKVHSSQDPADIVRDIIDNYSVLTANSMVSYSDASIDNTTESVSYTFNARKHLSCIQKISEFFPDGWYWYLGADGLMKVKQTTDGDHTLKLKREIKGLRVHKNIETLINKVFFWNAKDSNDADYIYSTYDDNNSQNDYDIRATYEVDGRVTNQATANAFGNARVNSGKDPKIRTEVVVDGDRYDIAAIEPGETVNIRNIDKSTQTTFDDNLVIHKIVYTPYTATLYLEEKGADITTSVETAQHKVENRLGDFENFWTDTPTANLALAGKEWVTDLIFSATDSNTISWGNRTITFSDGTTRSITAGNTGNMPDTTVIYLDDDISQTVLQTSQTMGDAIGDNKIPLCLGMPNADVTKNARTMPYKLGSGWQWGTEDLGDDAITAVKVDTAQLSAITADLGTITAGTVTGITFTGGTFQTATAGARRVLIDAATNRINFYDAGGTLFAFMGADETSDIVFDINQTRVLANNEHLFRIRYSPTGASDEVMCYFLTTGANAEGPTVEIENSSTAANRTANSIPTLLVDNLQLGRAVQIRDTNNSSNETVYIGSTSTINTGAVVIDRTGAGADGIAQLIKSTNVNSATDLTALTIDISNAGAGLEYAFEFANASLERALGAATTTKYIRVKDSGGAEYTLEIKSVA